MLVKRGLFLRAAMWLSATFGVLAIEQARVGDNYTDFFTIKFRGRF